MIVQYFRNRKNGELYRVESDNIIDATNATEGRIMVHYRSLNTGKSYVRERVEFLEKFEMVESD